jgi:phage tail-like protein
MTEQIPPFAGRFTITVDDLEIGSFTEVSGLTVTIDVEEVVEGGQNQFVHKLPKGMKWPNLTFKRGLTQPNTLFAWLQACSGDALNDHQVDRRNVAVTLLDAAGEPVRSWHLAAAFPVKWTGPRLAASSRDLAVEELEIAHHGFTVA